MALRYIGRSEDEGLYELLCGKKKEPDILMPGLEHSPDTHNPVLKAIGGDECPGPSDYEGFIRRSAQEGDRESL